MLTLSVQRATPEQLPIISGTRMGIEVIRGAAGSGKTTTALLRLESLAHTFEARRARLGVSEPVKILVLTFNRTLAGYVEELARAQLTKFSNVTCQIETFAAWASNSLGSPSIINDNDKERIFSSLLGNRNIELPFDFLLREIEYVCGRFPSGKLDDYLTTERSGRGQTPQITRPLRAKILTLIRDFYKELASYQGGMSVDWHLLTERMLLIPSHQYDIVIIDEAQDFSANQLRAVNHHIADQHCITLVMDTVQRLYPRGFTWIETGLNMQGARFHRLKVNHRNTIEIAAFASGIIQGIHLDDDGTMPDLSSASSHGVSPIVCQGLYSKQLEFAIQWLKSTVNLEHETVAFLKPKGGHWFDDIRKSLDINKLAYVEITRGREWPQGFENIALSTMHSSKGLEFDHVIILGLNAKNTPHGEGENDDTLIVLRRLLAMAVARARKSVIVGYKPAEASDLVQYFKLGTYQQYVV